MALSSDTPSGGRITIRWWRALFPDYQRPADVPGQWRDLLSACRHGTLAAIREAMIGITVPDHIDRDAMFEYFCLHCPLVAAQWWWSLGGVSQHHDGVFRRACGSGLLETAQWVWSLGAPSHSETVGKAFHLACRHGHLEVARWLWSLGQPGDHQARTDILTEGVQGGYPDLVRWQYSLGVNHPSVGSRAFVAACRNGQLETAQWLYSLGHDQWEGVDYRALLSACGHGHLPVVQWLSTQVPEVTERFCARLFSCACGHGRLEVAQWLHSLGQDIPPGAYQESFCAACGRYNLELVEWLYSLGGIDHRAQDDLAWQMACRARSREAICFLIDLGLPEEVLENHMYSDDNGPVIEARVRFWRQKSARSVCQ